MNRSEINALVTEAWSAFLRHGWALPPRPRWDVTDFGLGDVNRYGLVLINLAEEPEYCEKLMYARRGMETPLHHHLRKKEDIIVRAGALALELWPTPESVGKAPVSFEVSVNGERRPVMAGSRLTLRSGERITLTPGIVHAFVPTSDGCVIGEVSTANDDLNDNVFQDPNVGRFPEVVEDEPPLVRLVSDL